MANAIALAVQQTYARLGPTGKPQGGEWTVLAGIVIAGPSSLQVVALGTGTKCLTTSNVAANAAGWRLHDSHAEVCARRCFRLYLLAQLRVLTQGAAPGASVLQVAQGGGFELRPGLSLHFYTSQPPCGDASLFSEWDAGATARSAGECPRGAGVGGGSEQPSAKRARAGADEQRGQPSRASIAAAAAQPLPAASAGVATASAAASTLHQLGSAGADAASGMRTGARPASDLEAAAEAEFGGTLAKPGLLRTKPGRGERTCCMSCSDKLARWCALGLQGALLSLLLPTPLVPASITSGAPCCVAALRRSLRLHPSHPSQAPQPEPLLLQSACPFEHAVGDHPSSNSILWHAGECGAESGSETELAARCSAAVRTSASGRCVAGQGPPPPKQEAVNGLSGLRLGANKASTSPKVRSAASKSAFAEAFLQLCAALRPSAAVLLPAPLLRAAAASYNGGSGGGSRGGGARAQDSGEDREGGRGGRGGGGSGVGGGARAQDSERDREGGSVGGDRGTGGGSRGGAARGAGREAPRAMDSDAAQGLLAQPPEEAQSEPPARITYREAKRLAVEYQRRKGALLARAEFVDWVRAPPPCESFVLGE